MHDMEGIQILTVRAAVWIKFSQATLVLCRPVDSGLCQVAVLGIKGITV